MDEGGSGTGSPEEESIPPSQADPSQGPANGGTSGEVGAGESSRDADEDKQARPPKPPESAKGALAKVTGRRELADDDQGGTPGQEGENLGPATLSRFLTDYVIVVVSVLFLLGAAGVALYKTLWLGTPGLPWNGTSGSGP